MKSVDAPKEFFTVHYTVDLLNSSSTEDKWKQVLDQVFEQKPKPNHPLVAVPQFGIHQDVGILCDGPIFALDTDQNCVLWIDKPGYGQYKLSQLNADAENKENENQSTSCLTLVNRGVNAFSLQSPLLTLKSIWASTTSLGKKEDELAFHAEEFRTAGIVALYVIRMLSIDRLASIGFSEKIQKSEVWPGIRRYCENLGLQILKSAAFKDPSIELSEYSNLLDGLNLKALVSEIQKPSEVIPGLLLANQKKSSPKH
jgi:hypothetical protein